MHDMNLEKYRSKIQTAYKASPFTKGIFPEPEDAVKRFESRYAPIPAEYRWLLLNFGGCYLAEPVDEHKFAEVMQRAMWQLEREKEEMSLLIKADGSYMEVLAKNILYAENEARKIVLHTKNMPESSYTPWR